MNLNAHRGLDSATPRIGLGRMASAIAVAIALSACGGQTARPSVVDTGIQVVCRGTDCRPGLIVEIGDQAWALGVSGGVAIIHEHNAVEVRLLDPRTCEALADFTAMPGSGWLVTFESGGSPSVEETGAYELGPAMSEVPVATCP